MSSKNMFHLSAGRTLRRAVLVSAFVALAVAASAQASFLAYRCGTDLCRINPDGSGQTKLTSDGSYSSPSLSRTGTLLTWVRGNRAFGADANAGGAHDLGVGLALVTVSRPDGARVAVLHNESESGGLVPWTAEVNPDGSGFANQARYTTETGYNGGTLLRDGSSKTAHGCSGGSGTCPATAICIVSPDGTCGANVADGPMRDLYDATGSPDGSLIAVTAQPYPEGSPHPAPGGGAIALYSAATGALVRDITSGPGDSQPAWSPDASRIAFSRGGSIYVISLSGAPGSEKPLTAGDTPSWGGGPDTTPTPGPGPAPTPGTGPGAGTGGGKRSACAGKRGTALARCRALETYKLALAKCNRMKGKGKKAAKRKTACRRKASKAYKRALALIKCDAIKQKSKRPACRRRAHKAGRKN
jgi:hypothetical protein